MTRNEKIGSMAIGIGAGILAIVMGVWGVATSGGGFMLGFVSAALALVSVVAIGFTVDTMRTQKKSDRWCPDCGQKMKTAKNQTGFDSRTGKPSIKTWLECPAYIAGSGGYISQENFYRCHKTQRINLSIECHNPVDMTCPTCLAKLVDQGTISQSTANSLMP